MKPCRSNRKRIVWLLLNALEQDEATDLRTHLQVCAGCREYHLEISRVNHSLSSLQSTVTQNTPLKASASRPHQLIPSRTDLSPATSFIQNILPRLAWPALASVLLVTVIIVLVTHHPTTPSLPAHQTNVITAQDPPASVLPTLGNYRAVANQSIDQLDDLLSRQSKRPIPSPPAFSSVTFALLKVGD